MGGLCQLGWNPVACGARFGPCANSQPADDCPVTAGSGQVGGELAQRALDWIHGAGHRRTGPGQSPCSAPGRRSSHSVMRASISRSVAVGFSHLRRLRSMDIACYAHLVHVCGDGCCRAGYEVAKQIGVVKSLARISAGATDHRLRQLCGPHLMPLEPQRMPPGISGARVSCASARCPCSACAEHV